MAKIGNKELAQALTKKYGLDRTAAENFVEQMIDVLNEGLQYEKQVKVKGLGTFKITSVASRKSVDVNTGEPIIIEGRDKISYTPDASIRDQVNKPFAQFETVVVNEGVDFSEIDEKFADSMKEEDEQDEVNSDNAQVEVSAEEPLSVAPSLSVMEAEEGPHEESAEESLAISTRQLAVLNDGSASPMTLPTSLLAVLNGDKPVKKEAKAEAVPTPEIESTEPTIEVVDEIDDEAVEDIAANQQSTQYVEPLLHREAETVEAAESSATSVVGDDENRNDETNELQEKLYRQRKMMKMILAIAALLLVCFIIGDIYLMNQLEKRDHRIEHLEAQTQGLKPQYKALSVSAVTRSKDVPAAVKDDAKNTRKGVGQVNRPTADFKPEQAKTGITNPATAQVTTKKVETQKATAQKKPLPASPTKLSTVYDADPRVRTGAYNVVGIDYTVTVRAGQTLAGISKANLGAGMECYVEAVNGGKKEFKVGDKVNIPKLELKKKR